jgi:hypothetical protein
MSRRTRWLASGAAFALLCGADRAAAQTDLSAPTHEDPADASLKEIDRQLHNPISALWQLTVSNAIVGMDGGGLGGVEPSYTGIFEPQLPLHLNQLGLERFEWADDFNLVTRMLVPFLESVPLPPGSGASDRKWGFGDIQLGSVLAPNRTQGWVWGLGPTFIFPSASNDALGQGKWQAGPVAVGGYQGRKWTVYAIAQQWWSFAGDGDRATTNQLCLNYALLRSLPQQWTIGMQPSMTVDWTASQDSAVSFPVGLGIGKTLRFGSVPLQFWVEADYYAVRPDNLTSPRWGVTLQVTPVIRERF